MSVSFDESDKTGTKVAPKAGETTSNTAAGNPFEILSLMSQGAAMGPEIDKYLTDIKDQLDKTAAQVIGTDVRMVRLQTPAGTHAFIAGEHAILVLFDALLGPDLPNFIPKSAHIPKAIESVQKAHPGTVVHSAVIVQAQDYVRPSNMASYIIRTLAVELNPRLKAVKFSNLLGQRFIVDYDLASAVAIENQYSPHHTRPRANLGLTVRLVNPQQQQFGGGFNNSPDDTEPFLSIVGYTDWIRNDNDAQSHQPKFWPEPKITAITAPGPVKGIGILAAIIWAMAFGVDGRYRNQYVTFGDKQPNIGHLVDPVFNDGQVFQVKDLGQRDKLLNAWAYQALPSIAVVEGQARLAELSNFGDNSLNQRVLQLVADFFDVAVPAGLQAFSVSNIEYIGTIGVYGGQLEDSRNIDYLALMASEGAQNDLSRRLLYRHQNPTFRTEVIAQKTGTFRSISQEMTAILDRGLINFLAPLVSKMNLQSNAQSISQMDNTWMLHQNQLSSQVSTGSIFSPMGRPVSAMGLPTYGN